MQTCFECGNPVHDNNNLLLLEYLIKGSIYELCYRPRHIVPVFFEGISLCGGTPHRSQYLEGFPRHDGDFPYNPAFEYLVRAAYAKLQDTSFLDFMCEPA